MTGSKFWQSKRKLQTIAGGKLKTGCWRHFLTHDQGFKSNQRTPMRILISSKTGLKNHTCWSNGKSAASTSMSIVVYAEQTLCRRVSVYKLGWLSELACLDLLQCVLSIALVGRHVWKEMPKWDTSTTGEGQEEQGAEWLVQV
eukprot:6478289-Amphidinium_carterae.1